MDLYHILLFSVNKNKKNIITNKKKKKSAFKIQLIKKFKSIIKQIDFVNDLQVTLFYVSLYIQKLKEAIHE